MESAKLNHFKYISNTKVSSLLDQLEIDSEYRQGFWRFSLERLFALSDHHTRFPKEGLLHIESDVLILDTFPFEKFANIDNLSWSIMDRARDVAAILYSPNLDASNWLKEKMLEFLHEGININDMQLLSLVSGRYPKNVTILPTTPARNAEFFINVTSDSEAIRERVTRNFEIFGGIFDAAPIGIWLTGSHPVNSFGISRRYDHTLIENSSFMIDPSKMKFEFVPKEGLFLRIQKSKIAIHTLHIHSKNIDFFSVENSKLILKCVAQSDRQKALSTFSPAVLWSLLLDNYRKGTLIRYLSWLPPLNRIKIIFRYLLKGQRS
jgi:hypothetical protein